ncbi:MAG: hypothetical protein A3F42_03165 [Gammaproteobacteria bacterium RIFCSPHIGHO2_12_FULL_37_34]|nr:MAG: hypothetical protein A3F42_03165 [Gammaproteobacteria bacterium RIFCSPHIGHO2_12_FULL_37_34]
MKALATTRMSSKGQVVIPEEIRKSLQLTTGEQFVVLGERDVIILKIVTSPSMKNFDYLIHKAREKAKKLRLKKNDIKKAIKKARSNP